jgi:hypothetical protein
MPIRVYLAALTAALLLAGCLPPPSTSAPLPTAETTPSLPPAAATSPSPAMSFPEVVIVPDAGADGMQVLGLARNDSSLPLRDVSLRIDLLDQGGASLGSITAPLLLPNLQPGAASPFRAALPSGLAPVSTRITLEGYRLGARIPIGLALESISMAPSPDGTHLLGLIRNEGAQPLAIHQMAVVWRGLDGRLAGAGLASVPPVPVAPDRTVPWTAMVTDAVEGAQVEIFPAATVIRPGSAGVLETSTEPVWQRTSQGRGFVTGEIRNVGPLPVMPAVTVTLWAGGELVGLEILRSAVPLNPSETLAYGAEAFPALDERLGRVGADPQDVVPSVSVSGSAAPADSDQRLVIRILHFEAIGSRVYLGGTLTRTGERPLAGAEIHVALRSLEGILQSAAWMPVAPGSPGVSVPFRLDLPLPAGIDAELSEIDLRAIGLPFSP